jgi:hypothetical protein
MLIPELGNIAWRKSSYSGGGSGGGDCVELAELPDRAAIRDSKNPCGPALAFTSGAWNGFVSQLKSQAR